MGSYTVKLWGVVLAWKDRAHRFRLGRTCSVLLPRCVDMLPNIFKSVSCKYTVHVVAFQCTEIFVFVQMMLSVCQAGGKDNASL